MDESCEYRTEGNILFRTFKGVVTEDVIIESWRYMFHSGLISRDLAGIVSDYRGADLQAGIEGMKKMSALYAKNKDLIRNLKMAQIIDSEGIIYPMLLSHQHKDLRSQAFTTLEAAIKWIRA